MFSCKGERKLSSFQRSEEKADLRNRRSNHPDEKRQVYHIRRPRELATLTLSIVKISCVADHNVTPVKQLVTLSMAPFAFEDINREPG